MARRPLRAILAPRLDSPQQLQAALMLSDGEELGLAAVHPVHAPVAYERMEY